MKLRSLLLVLLLAAFSASLSADIVESKPYGFYFDAPATWNVMVDASQRSVVLRDSTGLATLTVEAFFHDDYQSLQSLKRARVAAYYDGWMIKYERAGTAQERRAAVVKEQALSVYTHYEADSAGRMREVIVGEYYFVTGNYSYVISVRTPTSAWPTVQGAVKKVVSSFSTGQYVYVPSVTDIANDNYHYGWECQGGRPDNTSFADSVFESGTVLQAFWSKELAKGTIISKYNSPVIYEGRVFIFDGSILHAYRVEDGEEDWAYALPGGLVASLVVSNGVVYVAQVGSPLHVVTAVSSESGMVLFTIPYALPVSALRVYSGILYVADSVGLSAYDAVTGLVLQKRVLSIQPKTYPVISTQSVFVATPTGLSCYTSRGLEKKWTFTMLGALSSSPLALRHVVVFPHQSAQQRWQLSGINPSTGAVMWEFVPEAGERLLPALCSDGSVICFVGIPQEGVPVLYGISSETGTKLWQISLKAHTDLDMLNVAAIQDMILCNTSDGLVAFSSKDGKSVPFHYLSKTGDKDLIRLFTIDNSSVFKLLERKQRFILECDR